MRLIVLCLTFQIVTFWPTTVLAQKQYGFDNRKASDQPYLSPDETVERLKVAPEFEVKLFAGEPMLSNPIAFTIDERGRVWAIESFEYPSRTPAGAVPRDRIVILEDTDGDGSCDKRTVFAEGKDFPVMPERKKANRGAFDLASGIEVGHGGVFVGAAPYLWFIENKDDRPGDFVVLLSGFGSEDTHEMLNTFSWGYDGWLYGLHGVFTQSNVKPGNDAADNDDFTKMNAAVWRYEPKLKKFEVFAEGTSNPWGIDYRNTDGQHILACCVIPHLFHIVPGGLYKRQAGASYNPYAYGLIDEICDHTFHKESGWAHAGLALPRRAAHAQTLSRERHLRQHPRLQHQAKHPETQRQHLHRKPRRRLPRQRRSQLPPLEHEVGTQRRHLPQRLARPKPLPSSPTRKLGLQAWPHLSHPAEGSQKHANRSTWANSSTEKLIEAAASDDPYTYRTALRLLFEGRNRRIQRKITHLNQSNTVTRSRIAYSGYVNAIQGIPSEDIETPHERTQQSIRHGVRA